MASKNRKTLKTYFQTGKIPNQEQYTNLIDSKLNLSDTDDQTITSNLIINGTLEAHSIDTGLGAFEVGQDVRTTSDVKFNTIFASGSNGHITASGNISSSGTLTIGTITNVNTTHITASGNISCSGTVIADAFQSSGEDDQLDFSDHINVTGNITASGNISASGKIIAYNIIVKSLTKGIAFSNLGLDNDQYIHGFGNVMKIDGDNYVQILADNEVKINAPKLGIGTSFSTLNTAEVPEALTVTGNISASGNIITLGNVSGSSTSTGSFGSLKIDGSSVDFSGLPTSDPGVTGRLWNDSNTVKISAG